MPSAPVIVRPWVPVTIIPALAGSAHRATTRARAAARRRLLRVEVRTIFGASGLRPFPARDSRQSPRREQVLARLARQKLTLDLYIVHLIQILRFSCDLLFHSLPRIFWQLRRYFSSSL